MRIAIASGGLAGLMVLSSATPARADIEGLQRVASGLAAPIFVTHAPGDSSRLFIAQRGGQIRILDLTTGLLQSTAFLSTTVDTSGEGGLLGLAFHPNYFNEGQTGFGKFYLNVTTGSPFTTRIREFTVSTTNPNMANAGSLREILSFTQPQTNHNGGWLGFSPNDDYLYIASGDGGGGNDDGTGHTPGTGNAQDITNNLLGKMLRIDVNGDDFPTDSTRNYAIPPTNPFKAGVGVPGDDVGDDEIWSYGLRNPFRASFDRQTGDLWIGDVGQSQREEIDFQPASSTGAENYGWRLREGLIQTPTVGGPKPPGNVDPVYDYDRNADPFGGTVVTGGYVYRGSDPSLRGKYFFLDSRNSATTADDNYWMFDPANPFGTVQNIDSLMTPNIGTAQFPVSFGEDALGNLYIAYLVSGEVYRIQTTSPGPPQWNVDAGGSWNTATNWNTASVPNSAAASANFLGKITAPRIITLDGNKTVGAIYFDNPNTYTIAPGSGGTLTIAGGIDPQGNDITVASGSHVISASLAIANSTGILIQGGAALHISGRLSIAAGQSVVAGGVLTISGPQNHGANSTFTTEGVGLTTFNTNAGTPATASTAAIANLGINLGADASAVFGADQDIRYLGLATGDGPQHLDLKSPATPGAFRSVRIYAPDLALAKTALFESIVSANAPGAPDPTLGIYDSGRGFHPNSAIGLALLPDAHGDNHLLIRLTRIGDLNLDGVVTISDFIDLASNFNTTGATWQEGDLNFDGAVTIADFIDLAANFNSSYSGETWPISAEHQAILSGFAITHNAALPEPGALLVPALMALATARRRRLR